jgi:MoaD family protein
MADNVTIHIPAALREQVDNQDVIEKHGATVGDVLGSLASDYPELGKRLYKDDSQLNRFINVYVDDEDIRFLDNLKTELKGGEEIAIVPAIAGG